LKLRFFSLCTLLVFGSVWPAAARAPASTLLKEQDEILFCSVSDTLMANNCSPSPGLPASAPTKRTDAFIQAESNAPDYLVGATPGEHVLVMIRRSLASPLDDANPGRAVVSASIASAPIVDPVWAVMPRQDDIDGYFPDRPARTAISGSATARCTVGPKGDLLGCWIANENPSEMGFGYAALKLSTSIQMKSETKDGVQTVGRPYAFHAAFDVNMKARTAKITLSSGQ